MPFIPSNEVVFEAWLLALTSMPAGLEAATTFPKDEVVFPLLQGAGFVRHQVVGGAPDIDVPQNQPVMQVEFWACKPNSPKIHWGKANHLAELLKKECVRHRGSWGRITTPSEYEDARVQVVNVQGEPRRITRDEARFGGYSLEAQMFWVRIEEG